MSLIDETIVLTARGVWLSNGTEITHESTTRGFARHLKRTPEGWFIIIGHEIKQITVEDTAYFVVRTKGNLPGRVEIFLNDGTHEVLDPATLKYSPSRLICQLKRGEEARFLSSAYFDLLHSVQEDSQGYWLPTSKGRLLLQGKKSS